MTQDNETIWISGSAIIRDKTGLHARPAVKVTKLAKSFESEVQISVDAAARWVNAKSPNAVMKLRAGHETRLDIRASGSDAEKAVAAISELVDTNFGEPVGG